MSLSLVQSRALLGLEAASVTVEVHLANGLPSFTLVGLAETEVKEARERVRSAIQNAGLEFPHNKRITVNLAPADLPKDSGRFDLPMALGILAASGQIEGARLAGHEFAGELSLSGELRPVRGALAMALALHTRGIATRLVLPATSADEAALVPGGAGYNTRLGDGVDVVFGGGTDYFTPKEDGGKRNDKRNLIAELKSAKYGFAASKAEFDKLPADGTTKIAGLFTKSHMAYDLDRDAGKEPSLAEMTGKAIDALAARRKGFFLMVEGGRIDHALHATNARRALQDTGAFDDAIKLALDKMKAIDPGLKNTLVVVTADHDHTLQLNGYAARTGKTEAGKPGVLGLVKDYVDTSKTSKDVDGNPYTIIGFGNGPRRLSSRGPIGDAELEGKDYRQEAVVPMDAASDSETHGGADVFLGAQGLGAENFSGVITNTDVFGLIRKAVGL